jgi:hypothetical protein
MIQFKYVMTIPSVDIKGFVAINDLALIGSDDDRYQKLQAESAVMAKYLAAFRSPYGTLVQPSIVIRDVSLPKVDARRLCDFRNAIAVASVLRSLIEKYTKDGIMGAYCTDLFDFHPVSVSSDGTDLIGRTLFEKSIGMDVAKFSGSTTPSIIFPQHVRVIPDEWLMMRLLNLLEMRCRRKGSTQFKNRVFRSIDMAYYALRAPMVNLGAQVDFGVGLSLWVSAFETLAHPGIGKVTFSHVSSMIKDVPWQSLRLRRKTYTSVGQEKKPQKPNARVTLPVQVYSRLYCSRNRYAHGNPLPAGRYEFVHRKSWGNLWFQVPALYRCVLCHLLATNAAAACPNSSDILARTYEDALLKQPGKGD